jgi:hypothetical protein
MMSELVDKVLREAGWDPERLRSSEGDLILLGDNQFPVGEQLGGFLSEYGDLAVKYVRNGQEDGAVIDVRNACAWADPEWVREYSERAGTVLSPIGYANHQHLILLMGEDGRFFGGFGDFLGYLGESGREMIERLATQEIPVVP